MSALEGAAVAVRKSPLSEKLEQVRERIAAAATKAGREPKEVTLVAVTKTAAPEQIREIVQLGVADLGESRVQVIQQRIGQVNEFLQRQRTHGEPGAVPARVRWHMLGHLQRNKVKPLLPMVDYIHSIDSLRLAEEIETHAAKLGKKVPVLLEINASEEKSKFGVAVGASVHLAEQIDTMTNLQLVGLMTMAPLTEDKTEIRQCFSRVREIFEEMKWHKIGGASLRHLSMGMSNDFEEAIAEGATMVRIGTSLFGGNVQSEQPEAAE
ncbi:MAG TPA: YggS family pyridoxal phosphate-dependent enzyme [Tepidisphaeraceae bacterium]|nr:YggS family pyridoxal phosphate-dependent enzyme [Tepidisphaeraceae bacterium]